MKIMGMEADWLAVGCPTCKAGPRRTCRKRSGEIVHDNVHMARFTAALLAQSPSTKNGSSVHVRSRCIRHDPRRRMRMASTRT